MRPEEIQRLADEELMTLVARKEPAAFEVFYDRHGTSAYSLAYRIVGDRALAEDVAQEAFLSIWRSRSAYDRARGSVRAWTLGIVRNRAIDAVRRGAAPTAKLGSGDEAVLAEQPADDRTESWRSRRRGDRSLRRRSRRGRGHPRAGGRQRGADHLAVPARRPLAPGPRAQPVDSPAP